jgi:peptidoglycan-associated lipoprotein
LERKMKKQVVLWVAVSGLMAGCAGLTGDEAPVEDRAAGRVSTGQPVPITESGAAGQAAGGGVSTQGLGSARIAESSQAGGKPAGQVETRPLPTQEARVVPMQSTGQPAGGGESGQAGAGEGPHGGGKVGAVSMGAGQDINDPGSLLAKRIIYFDYDSSALRDEYRDLLEAHAGHLKSRPTSRVLLQGHADERGSREYNLALGQRRAEGVLQALSLLGVGQAQMEAVSFGEEKPVAEGHDEESWRQNRRTEILYQSQ